MIKTRVSVPSAGLLQVSAGELLSPSHVYLIGIGSPEAKAGLRRVRAWLSAVRVTVVVSVAVVVLMLMIVLVAGLVVEVTVVAV
jgi:hypothetical protein